MSGITDHLKDIGVVRCRPRTESRSDGSDRRTLRSLALKMHVWKQREAAKLLDSYLVGDVVVCMGRTKNHLVEVYGQIQMGSLMGKREQTQVGE